MFNKIFDKLKECASYCNSKGIPLPTVRDPKTGVGSVTLTLVFISFSINIIALIGKAAGYFGTIDLSGASYLFLMSLGSYLGRKMQGTGKNIDISAEPEDKK